MDGSPAVGQVQIAVGGHGCGRLVDESQKLDRPNQAALPRIEGAKKSKILDTRFPSAKRFRRGGYQAGGSPGFIIYRARPGIGDHLVMEAPSLGAISDL